MRVDLMTDARLFVIAAPSGAGKTTLVKELIARNSGLKFSISYTTREKRETETDGIDYFFVDVDSFHKLQKEGELLESAVVFGNHYGTSRSQVEQHLANNDSVILEIDWQGARQVRDSMPDCITIFIMPPSARELERRLRDRRTDSEAVIDRRLSDALGDMSHWSEFDHVIINDRLADAVTKLESVLRGEGHESRSDDREMARTIKKMLV